MKALFVQVPIGSAEGAALATSVALFVSLVTPAPAALRFVLAVIFVACGPGTAILVAFGGRSPASLEVGLIVALGMATTALVSESLLWMGAFYPRPEVAAAAAAVTIVIGMTSWWRARGPIGAASGSDGRTGHDDAEMRPGRHTTGAGPRAGTDDLGES